MCMKSRGCSSIVQDLLQTCQHKRRNLLVKGFVKRGSVGKDLAYLI